jgi:hypothetical protein
VSAGKPMWVTECSVHVNWSGDERLKELSEEDARLQSERLTKTYALSIYQGAAAVFYFVLPHYVERTLQYGILRSDLTPRPAYVAAAAVGRLLAGAKPRGRIDLPEGKGQAYCFSAEPDGKKSDVLILWSKDKLEFKLPAKAREAYDHLGRAVNVQAGTVESDSAPKFVVLDAGAVKALIAPPKPAKVLGGKPVPIVLQPLLPESDTVLQKSAYKIAPSQKKTFPLYVYNFGMSKSSGTISATAPEGWRVECKGDVAVAPGERHEVSVEVQPPAELGDAETEVRFNGDFGADGKPLVSIRFVKE